MVMDVTEFGCCVVVWGTVDSVVMVAMFEGRFRRSCGGIPYHLRMALELRDIEVQLGGRSILQALSADFAPGALTAILGPNGAGKSTLLRAIFGAIEPIRGTITLFGRDSRGFTARERRKHFAYIAQRSSVEFAFTAREVVGFAHYGEHTDHRTVHEALERTGMIDFAEYRFDELSVGQQQRVSIARAIAQLHDQNGELSGKVLLADEPVASLDPAHAIEALDLMSEMARRGAIVVIVMHDLTTALRRADHALVLSADGRVAGAGNPADLVRTEVLQDVYDIELRPADTSFVVPLRRALAMKEQRKNP